jgi:hypothetical protein
MAIKEGRDFGIELLKALKINEKYITRVIIEILPNSLVMEHVDSILVEGRADEIIALSKDYTVVEIKKDGKNKNK